MDISLLRVIILIFTSFETIFFHTEVSNLKNKGS